MKHVAVYDYKPRTLSREDGAGGEKCKNDLWIPNADVVKASGPWLSRYISGLQWRLRTPACLDSVFIIAID